MPWSSQAPVQPQAPSQAPLLPQPQLSLQQPHQQQQQQQQQQPLPIPNGLLVQLQSFAQKQHQHIKQESQQQPLDQQHQQSSLLHTNVSAIVSVTSSPTALPSNRIALPTKKRLIHIDDDDDDGNAGDDHGNVATDADAIEIISQPRKARRAIIDLTHDEQQELDAIEAQRAQLFEKAQKRKQKRDSEDLKLRELLTYPTDEQRALLLSMLSMK